MMGIAIVIGLICGLLAASIGSGKGRDGVSWFLVGFFFGLIGVLVSVLVSDRRVVTLGLEGDTSHRRPDDVAHRM